MQRSCTYLTLNCLAFSWSARSQHAAQLSTNKTRPTSWLSSSCITQQLQHCCRHNDRGLEHFTAFHLLPLIWVLRKKPNSRKLRKTLFLFLLQAHLQPTPFPPCSPSQFRLFSTHYTPSLPIPMTPSKRQCRRLEPVMMVSAAPCFLLVFLHGCLLLTHFLHSSLSSSMGYGLSGGRCSPWSGSSKTCDFLGQPAPVLVGWELQWSCVDHLLPTVDSQLPLLHFSLPAATL